MTDHLVDEEAGDLDADTGRDAPSASTTPDRAAGITGSAFERWRERRRHRVNRWDRPPQPKDWRFVVGTLGKILIATGLLMFGFVAYQLWGTGIETALAQSELEDEFQDQVRDVADEPAVGFQNWVKPVRDDTDADPGSDTDNDTGSDTGSDPDTAGDAGDVGDDGVTDVGADPEVPSTEFGPPSDDVPGAVDLSEYAIDQDVPIVPGDSFALLEIPEIGVSTYIVPGVRLTDLKRGIGHYPDTPLPGQLGNASLAGHRTTYGGPFFDLDQLVPGDEIEVTMVTGDRFVYRVTGAEIVTAADYWVVTTRDPNVAELTLTTCDPKYTARNRLVIHSVLVPEKSSQVGEAEFYQAANPEPDDEIPGDDPTLEPFDPAADDADDADADADAADDAPTTVTTVTTDGAAIVDSTTPGTTPATTPATTAPGSAGATDDTVDPDVSAAPIAPTDPTEAAATTPRAVDPDAAELDAFSQGWFDDRGAFPQIALWAMALTIVSLLAYQVSKKTRHHSIGVMVGVAPFLFSLYFFYQNINRLLPPGL